MGTLTVWCAQCIVGKSFKFVDPLDVKELLVRKDVLKYLAGHNRDVIITVRQED